MWDIPLLLDSKQYIFISNMISPTDLFHPPPAPHFKTLQARIHLTICSELKRKNSDTGKHEKADR